jgi:hypothetical protein
MHIRFPEIGICGLSCRLCPMSATSAASKCRGCKSPARMAVGCPFITCAVRKKGIEFCWECDDHTDCDKWKNHRAAGKHHDSFKCYQTLEEDISFIDKKGIDEFDKIQHEREQVLHEMLQDFNEGRSKNYYCIAATVFDLEELREAVARAKKESEGLDVKGKSKILHSVLDAIALERKYTLTLRK